MRTTALVLGIVGGVFGIIAGLLAMTIGGTAAAFDAEGGGEAAGGGLVALLMGVAGIVGGALANKNPRASWIILLLAAVIGFIATFVFWIIPGLLLLAAAVFAFASRKQRTGEVAAA